MLFAARITNFQNTSILNMCDAPLLGKTLSKNNFKIHISRNYYGEKLIEQEEAKKLLQNCSSLNMVGKETISLSVSLGIGSMGGVKEIENVPFLLVFKL